MLPTAECVLASSNFKLETAGSVTLDVGEDISLGGGGRGGAAEGVGFVVAVRGKGGEEMFAVGASGRGVHLGVFVGEVCGIAVVVPCMGGRTTADIGIQMRGRGRG